MAALLEGEVGSSLIKDICVKYIFFLIQHNANKLSIELIPLFYGFFLMLDQLIVPVLAHQLPLFIEYQDCRQESHFKAFCQP